ncbi:hypothetical protein PG985_009836 [Apiospora marii]|uniref:uncharacterized protein n=1 Tax=Apiospora marii TaxID=335849 RepID=UPI00312EBBFF
MSPIPPLILLTSELLPAEFGWLDDEKFVGGRRGLETYESLPLYLRRSESTHLDRACLVQFDSSRPGAVPESSLAMATQVM